MDVGKSAVVSMRGIVKKFPGVVANDNIDLDILEGEVLALLGENGAGKTTLMNILYGLYTPDEGEIYVRGKRVSFRSPKDAIVHGIGMVHQHFTLVEDLTVVENVILGLKEFGIILNLRRAADEVRRVASEVGFKIDPLQRVWQLSAGEKQKVEILKALFRRVKVLILDEPTSVLTPQDVKELFKTIRRLVGRGMSVVFISHKLYEVMEIADRIVVLRRGRVVGRLRRDEANPKLLAKLMVGREVFLQIEKPPATVGREVLEVRDLRVLSDKGTLALKGISFRVKEGEIVGVAGVAGNGQKELAETLYGLRRPLSGRIIFQGRDITRSGIAERVKLGISLIPEERVKLGIVADFSVAENFILELVDREPFSLRIPLVSATGIKSLNRRAIEEYARRLISKYNIVTPSPFTKAGKLSGGNIQRLMVAREFERAPRFVIAEEPTAGLDVAATEYVRKLLVNMRSKGHAILLISSDLSEVLSLSDKVMVMYEGEIVGVFRPGALSVEDIGLMMAGVKRMPKEEVERAWLY